MRSPLDEALMLYKAALTELERAEAFSHEQVLNILLARDRIQEAIVYANLINAEIDSAMLLLLFRLDQTLKQMGGAIRKAVDLESWRSSYRPKQEAWWWFLDSAQNRAEAESAIVRYKTAIEALESSDLKTIQLDIERWAIEDLAGVFIVRDAVQTEIEDEQISPDDLAIIVSLDKRLKQQVDEFPRVLDSKGLRSLTEKFDELRDVLNPSDKAWWWFLKISVHWWDRFDFAWNTLTVLWLTATFSLLTDIASRFLGRAGPGLFGAFAITFQSILALAGGGALTKTGQLFIDRTLRNWKVPKHQWQEAKFIAASLLLIAFIGFRLSLPGLSKIYVNRGTQDYKFGKLDSAESKYLRAISLNPDNILAHYSLGVIYEKLGDLDGAKEKYNLAVAGGLDLAYNKLARLEILSENHADAADLLLEGLRRAEDDIARYDMLNNLGWARFEQSRYEQARKRLQTAISLEQGLDKKYWRASVHCLMAKNLESLGEDQAALKFWENCFAYPRGENNPTEDEWIYEAKKRLNQN